MESIHALIALGGNLGNVRHTFQSAIRLINTEPHTQVITTSSLYRTASVGEQAGDDFLNAAIEVETTLGPTALLRLLQSIENQLGRERVIHWGPRTLDLDLILYGQRIVKEAHLNVPHPAYWYRRFVIEPLNEIAPDWKHPERGKTTREFHQLLATRPLHITLICDDTGVRDHVSSLIESHGSEIQLAMVTSDSITNPKKLTHECDPGHLLISFLPLPTSIIAEYPFSIDLTLGETEPTSAFRHVLDSVLDEPKQENL